MGGLGGTVTKMLAKTGDPGSRRAPNTAFARAENLSTTKDFLHRQKYRQNSKGSQACVQPMRGIVNAEVKKCSKNE